MSKQEKSWKCQIHMYALTFVVLNILHIMPKWRWQDIFFQLEGWYIQYSDSIFDMIYA